MRAADGRLFHRFREGERAIRGQAADYAFLIQGLLQLHRATFDLAWAEEAAALQGLMLREFWDDAAGGFFLAGQEEGELPVRPKEIYDGAIPSANSVALMNLLWLARLTGDAAFAKRANALVSAFAGTVARSPSAFAYFLCGLDFALRPGQDLVIAAAGGAGDTQALLATLNRHFTPNQIAHLKSDENAGRLARFAGFTDGLKVARGETTAHICVGSSCHESVTGTREVLERILGKHGAP